MFNRFYLFMLFFVALTGSLAGQERVAYVGGAEPDDNVVSHNFSGIKEVKFELDGGIILVEAVLNNTLQTFILDSGAPGLVLNNFQKKGRKEKISGINGTADAYALTVENFRWAGINYTELAAISMDLSHLESLTKRKISGLIGYELIKDFELLLDYSSQAIQIRRLDAEPAVKSQPLVSFPLYFEDHLPVIEAVIGKEKLRLGLDTGAEINLLDDRLSSRIASVASEPQPFSKIHGVGEDNNSAHIIKVELTKVARAAYRQMEYVLTDFTAINHNSTNIDGILGFPFLSSCKFSIDFKSRKLHVWP